jgi:hypothetical protein
VSRLPLFAIFWPNVLPSKDTQILAPQKILRTTCCARALFAIFQCNMSSWTKGTEIKLVDAAVNALHVLGQGLYVAIPARIG